MMKAIKIFLLSCGLAAIPAFGDVEALYWQITSANNEGNIPFSYAVLVGVNDTNPSQTHQYADANGNVYQKALAGGTTTDVIASIIDSEHSTGWSFYVELWNYANDTWTMTGTAGAPGTNYKTLKDNSMIRTSMSTSTALFTPTAVIPEPTSGLLVLVGGALLALRRRRRA